MDILPMTPSEGPSLGSTLNVGISIQGDSLTSRSSAWPAGVIPNRIGNIEIMTNREIRVAGTVKLAEPRSVFNLIFPILKN